MARTVVIQVERRVRSLIHSARRARGRVWRPGMRWGALVIPGRVGAADATLLMTAPP